MPPTEPDDAMGLGGIRPGRHILIVDRAAVAEQIEEHDAGKTNAVFRGALDFGLVLSVDLAGKQLLIAFQLIDALLQLSGVRSVSWRLLVDDTCLTGIASGLPVPREDA